MTAKPPPNITICSQCRREHCPGHPVFATLVYVALALALAAAVVVQL